MDATGKNIVTPLATPTLQKYFIPIMILTIFQEFLFLRFILDAVRCYKNSSFRCSLSML
jgi:hypothetical protein